MFTLPFTLSFLLKWAPTPSTARRKAIRLDNFYSIEPIQPAPASSHRVAYK